MIFCCECAIMSSKSWWDLQYPSVLKGLISFSHKGILLSRNGFDAIYVAHGCGNIRRENSFACLRSTISNCCAQLFQNSSLSFLSVYAPAICSSPTNSRTDSFSPSILYTSRNLFILGNVNCHHPLWGSKGNSDPRGEELYDWVISFDLPLNDPDIATLPRCFYGSRYSPDIFFAPSSLALSCSWEVIQDLGADHLPILLTVPFSLLFRPNERPLSFNFQKAR